MNLFLIIFLISLLLCGCATGPEIVIVPVKCHPETEATMKLAGFEENIGGNELQGADFPIYKTTGVKNPQKVKKIYIKICK